MGFYQGAGCRWWYGGDTVPKREVKIPEALEEWVLYNFGPTSESRAEAYRQALTWAFWQWAAQYRRAGYDDPVDPLALREMYGDDK